MKEHVVMYINKNYGSFDDEIDVKCFKYEVLEKAKKQAKIIIYKLFKRLFF